MQVNANHFIAVYLLTSFVGPGESLQVWRSIKINTINKTQSCEVTSFRKVIWTFHLHKPCGYVLFWDAGQVCLLRWCGVADAGTWRTIRRWVAVIRAGLTDATRQENRQATKITAPCKHRDGPRWPISSTFGPIRLRHIASQCLGYVDGRWTVKHRLFVGLMEIHSLTQTVYFTRM